MFSDVLRQMTATRKLYGLCGNTSNGNTAGSSDYAIPFTVDPKLDHQSVNLDLDSSDFKSNESFFKKDSPDQKSGFGFAERNTPL